MTHLLGDFVLLVLNGFALGAGSSVKFAVLGLSAAVLIGIAVFWGSSALAHLWHRQATSSPGHLLWCGISASIAFGLTVAALSVWNLDLVAEERISRWSKTFSDASSINSVRVWDAAGRALVAAGIPQDANAPNKHSLPSKDAVRISAKASADEAIAIFGESNPVFAVLSSKSGDQAAELTARVDQQAFDRGTLTRPFSETLAVLQPALERDLLKKIPQLRDRFLALFGLLGVFAGLAPLLAPGIFAYLNIRVPTSTRHQRVTRTVAKSVPAQKRPSRRPRK